MSYATILVQTDLDFSADDRVRFAARLARTFDAHLVGLALTDGGRCLPPALVFAGGVPATPRVPTAGDDAVFALQRFAGIVREEGVLSSETARIDTDGAAALARQARHCDLAVVAQADRSLSADAATPALAARLAGASGRPVLSLPSGGWRRRPGGPALIAWDGSAAAVRAVAGALPLLRLASAVTVLAVDDGATEPATRQADCALLAVWLARHGIGAQAASAPLAGDSGAALLAAARQAEAGLLVMGAGGESAAAADAATAVLAAASVPVLMAG